MAGIADVLALFHNQGQQNPQQQAPQTQQSGLSTTPIGRAIALFGGQQGQPTQPQAQQGSPLQGTMLGSILSLFHHQGQQGMQPQNTLATPLPDVSQVGMAAGQQAPQSYNPTPALAHEQGQPGGATGLSKLLSIFHGGA